MNGITACSSACSTRPDRAARPGWRAGLLVLCAVGLVAGAPPAAAGDDIVGPAVSAAFGPDGRLWRAVPRKSGIEVDVSSDLGKTFSKPVRASRRGEYGFAEPEGRPWIGVDGGGVVYVAYPGAGKMAATLVRSDDGGRSFGKPVAVPAGAAPLPHIRLFLHVADDGPVRLYFIDPAGGHTSQPPRPGGVIYEAAPDGRRLAARRVVTGSCECCRLDVDTEADGTPVLLTRMVFGEDTRDFGIARLGPGTPEVVRVTDDEWHIEACPEHGPGLSIAPDGRYHFVWFTQGERRKGLFYAWSDDRGRTTSVPLPLGATGSLPGHGDVLAAGDAVYLAWRQYDGEHTSVHAMTSTDRGATWSAPRQIGATTATADYPLLITDGKAVYVSWYATEPGYQLLPLVPAAAPVARRP